MYGNLNKEFIEDIIKNTLSKYKTRITLVPINKDNLSKEEIELRHEIRKKERMDNLREKYLEEDSKKEWITEIVKKRKERIKN